MQVTGKLTRRQRYGQHRSNATYTPPNVNDPFRGFGDEGWDVGQFRLHPHVIDHRSTRTLPQKEKHRENFVRENAPHRTCERGRGTEGRTIRCPHVTPQTPGEVMCVFRVPDTRTHDDTDTQSTCDLSQEHILTVRGGFTEGSHSRRMSHP